MNYTELLEDAIMKTKQANLAMDLMFINRQAYEDSEKEYHILDGIAITARAKIQNAILRGLDNA